MNGAIDTFSHNDGSGWIHSFLSNGFTEPDGSFVEREYQACKTDDPEWSTRILACEHPFGPGGSKILGREAPLRPDWEEVKFQVMARCVLAKFLDHPELARQLLATGDALIIEGNTWHDNVWGDCRCGRPECSVTGTNWLGHVLMGVRETLRQTA
jgi:ribA/ribD-fused uncharacterized protein